MSITGRELRNIEIDIDNIMFSKNKYLPYSVYMQHVLSIAVCVDLT